MIEPQLLIELTLHADFDEPFFADELIGRYAAKFGNLNRKEQNQLSNQVRSTFEYLCQNAIWYHERPRVDCALLISDSNIVVRFADKAQPWSETVLRRNIAQVVSGETTDGDHYHIEAFNLGLGGRQLRLTMPVCIKENKIIEAPEPFETVPGEIGYRLLEPNEAHEMVSCIYSAYGYTYGIPDVYSHAETCQMMENGEIVVLAAESEAGKVGGVSTLRKRVPDSKIFDLCQTAVKPEYKGKRIFENLLSGVLETAEKTLNAQGLSGTIPNRHLVSQNRLEKAGFTPVGIFLGIVPADFLPQAIGPFAQERESFLLIYKSITQPDFKTIYSPIHHEAILTRLCGQLDMTMPIQRIEASQNAHGRSVVQRREIDNMRAGFIEVQTAGSDIVDQVFESLAHFKGRHFGSVHLYLDLSDPVMMGYCERFEAMGFFFAGFLPDEKPWLILQYLNNVPVLFDELVYPFPGSKYIQYHIQWLYRRVKLREKGEFAAADEILPVPDLSQFPSDWRTNDDLIMNHDRPEESPNLNR
ncbi:MAG: hypothetical protein AB8G95_31110 [Anaerolineae bacterium]